MDEFDKVKEKYSEVLSEFNNLVSSGKDSAKLVEDIGSILKLLEEKANSQSKITENLQKIEETLSGRLDDTQANVKEASDIVGIAKDNLEKLNENNEKIMEKMEEKIDKKVTDLSVEVKVMTDKLTFNIKDITDKFNDLDKKISLIKEVKKNSK